MTWRHRRQDPHRLRWVDGKSSAQGGSSSGCEVRMGAHRCWSTPSRAHHTKHPAGGRVTEVGALARTQVPAESSSWSLQTRLCAAATPLGSVCRWLLLAQLSGARAARVQRPKCDPLAIETGRQPGPRRGRERRFGRGRMEGPAHLGMRDSSRCRCRSHEGASRSSD
jgi:hypothetical protein